MRRTLVAALVLLAFRAGAQNAPSPVAPEVFAKAGESTVAILAGEGAGRLTSVTPGVIIQADGVLLTTFHALKDAREVQVRLKNGEAFDNVVLLGVDERRNIAALKIPASGLPVLPMGVGGSLKPGEPVYAVSHARSLQWSSAQGMVSSIRLADEVPGAGQGYRFIQFKAPLSNDAAGGPLVDGNGALVGIITAGNESGMSFAIPIESVAGLAAGPAKGSLGNGSSLRMPSQTASPASRGVASVDPKELARSAKSVVVLSKTTFFTADRLDRELVKQAGFQALGLLLVNDSRVADLVIMIDRPLFTWTFTWELSDLKTSVVLAAGKVTAADGNAASGKIAKQIVAELTSRRQAPPAQRSN